MERIHELAILDYCPRCEQATNRRAIDRHLAPLIAALGTKSGLYVLAAYDFCVDLAELHICPKCLAEAADGDTSPAPDDHSIEVYRALAR